MLYQLQKLKERVLAAQGARGEVLERHVRRACALLAPGGVRQEEALAFGDLMLRFSHGLPEELGRALDFASLDHQLIAVDGGA
jgi:hypothetical protein